jgi:hypothetical protein
VFAPTRRSIDKLSRHWRLVEKSEMRIILILASCLWWLPSSAGAELFSCRQKNGQLYVGVNPPADCEVRRMSDSAPAPPKSKHDPAGADRASIDAGKIRATNACKRMLGNRVSGEPILVEHLGGGTFDVQWPGIECRALDSGNDRWSADIRFSPSLPPAR